MTSLTDILEADRSQLVERWTEMFDIAPPPRLSRGIMVRILACEVQWAASPRSRADIVRRLERVAKMADQTPPIAKSGTRLVREWNGRRHVVDVTPDGYVWQGRAWRSLSAIAKEITGTKWSGPRFFGVAA